MVNSWMRLLVCLILLDVDRAHLVREGRLRLAVLHVDRPAAYFAERAQEFLEPPPLLLYVIVRREAFKYVQVGILLCFLDMHILFLFLLVFVERC